jgi:hypothetical protein
MGRIVLHKVVALEPMLDIVMYSVY